MEDVFALNKIELLLQDFEKKNLISSASIKNKKLIRELIFKLVLEKINKGNELKIAPKVIFKMCQENYWFNRYISYYHFYKFFKNLK